MSKELPQPEKTDEVDLGQLFKLIGNAFDRFFRFIGRILNSLFLAFVWVVFFVKKHIIKLVVAGVIGSGIGLFLEKGSQPIYKSSSILKQNYKTGENLYRLIDYYNALIDEKDLKTLNEDFKIDESKLSSIVNLDVEAVITDNDRIEGFDKYTKGLDSVLASTIKFEDYVKNSEEFDHSFQRIILKAKSKDVFSNVIPKIVEKINNTAYFKNEQKKDLDELTRQEEAIKESLLKSDSLKLVYQEVLIKSVDKVAGSQTSIKIDNTEDKSVTKEYELYESDVELRRELVEIQRKKEDKAHIIEIVSSQENSGTIYKSVELFGFELSKKIALAILLSVFMFLFLLAKEFISFLERFKGN